jgi:hypothetical protein
MLETIRAYGLERLDEAGERESVCGAYIRYFVELAEAAEPHLRRAEQLEWLRRLRADHDNLNVALREAIAVGDAQNAVRLVAAAGWYWWLSGNKAGGIERAIEALGVPGEVDEKTRAEVCAMVAYFSTAGLGDQGPVGAGGGPAVPHPHASARSAASRHGGRADGVPLDR